MYSATAENSSATWIRAVERVSRPVIPVRPDWLETIERRIKRSIGAADEAQQSQGELIEWPIALQAISFLQTVHDLLPGAPYIYGALDGDLVAEFKIGRGVLTAIFGRTSIELFAARDGKIVDDLIEVRRSTPPSTRQIVQQLTRTLTSAEHGAVDSRS
jgi:hypothetical protein